MQPTVAFCGTLAEGEEQAQRLPTFLIGELFGGLCSPAVCIFVASPAQRHKLFSFYAVFVNIKSLISKLRIFLEMFHMVNNFSL